MTDRRHLTTDDLWLHYLNFCKLLKGDAVDAVVAEGISKIIQAYRYRITQRCAKRAKDSMGREVTDMLNAEEYEAQIGKNRAIFKTKKEL